MITDQLNARPLVARVALSDDSGTETVTTAPPASVTRERALEWLWTVVALLLHAVALAPPVLLLLAAGGRLPPVAVAALLPAGYYLYLLGLLLVLGLVRACVPRVTPGTTPIQGNRAPAVWLLHYATLNVVRLPGHERLIAANPLLRRLYYRVFGARIDPTARVSYEATLIDPWLVTIGPGAKVGAYARIGGHAADLSSFVLARTTIGAGALIGADVLIGPGVTVGAGALVAPRSAVPPGTAIPAGELWGGLPARRIGRVEDLLPGL